METAGKKLKALRGDVSWRSLRDYLLLDEGLEPHLVPSEATLRRMENSVDGSDWPPVIAGLIVTRLGGNLRDISPLAADAWNRVRSLMVGSTSRYLDDPADLLVCAS